MKRALYILPALLAIAYVVQLPAIQGALERTGGAVRTALFLPEVRIEGGLRPIAASLSKRVPRDLSLLSWLFGSQEIIGRLLADPQVREASIERCSTFSISCFSVHGSLRSAELLLDTGGQQWLISSEGAFLPSSPDDVLRGLPYYIELRASELPSQELISRVRFVQLAVDAIRQHMEAQVEKLSFPSSRVLRITMHDIPFDVILSADTREPALVESELARVGIVLGKLRDRWSEIETIDVGFQRLAVVHFHDGKSFAPQDPGVPNRTKGEERRPRDT